MENPYRPTVARIIRIRRETRTEKTFAIAFNRENAQCGQFYELSLPGRGEAPFSISYIGGGCVEFTIRKIGALTTAIHNLNVNDKIYLRGPYGHGFPLEKFFDRELALIAGGTGVSPVRAIIKKVEEGSLSLRHLKILLGFRDNESILYRDDIKRWQRLFNCLVSLDYPEKNWRGLSGFVNQHIDKLRLKKDACAVIVGPPVMIKFVADELVEQGIAPQDIRVSLERLMQCGIGKCGHCRIESCYVCQDGPVFDYTSARGLID